MDSVLLPDLSGSVSPIQFQDEPDLLAVALAYARLGWRVFPLQPRSKCPIRRPGHRAATSAAQTIRTWWAVNRTCNIGLATGAGLVVLDLDPVLTRGTLPMIAKYQVTMNLSRKAMKSRINGD